MCNKQTNKFKIGCIFISSVLALPANAFELIKTDTTSLSLYGQLAGSLVDYSDGGKGPVFESESRVGFRMSNKLSNGMTIYGQIEGGNSDAGGSNALRNHGSLGYRDTFIGIKGAFGQIRVGRMLTPLYQFIDWPYSNPGLGRVFDWGGTVPANYDRQSNQIRYDSNNYNGLTFATSIGRDTPNITSGDATKGSYFYGANVHYTMNKMITLLAGIETAKKFQGKDQDTLTYLGGVEANLGSGFELKAAYKNRENKNTATNIKSTQGSYSIVGQYSVDKYLFRLGYAANLDSKVGDIKQDDSDSIVSFQPMYITDGVTFYARYAHHMARGNAKNNNIFRVGFEYPF
ncbi:MAG: porin [Ostreibacterium sp.]